MPNNTLQDAITLIKAGDRSKALTLLTEILKDDPRNEQAWLWLSTLATGDKRRRCLEKALEINPNNEQARQELMKIQNIQAPQAQPSAPTAPGPAPSVAPPTVEPSPVLAPGHSLSSRAPGNQVWLTPGKHLSTIIYLTGEALLAFDVLPQQALQVLSEIQAGNSPRRVHDASSKYHLQNICYLPVSSITNVTLFGELLKVSSGDSAGREKKYNITCSKKDSEAVLGALQQQLDPAFKRITRPISRAQVLASGAAVFLIGLCGTGFLYWFVQGLAAEGSVGGSARARGIANLLLLIGPNGFLCLGGVFLLIVIVALISSLAKPPEETVLTRNPA
jgi:hypothetical protein